MLQMNQVFVMKVTPWYQAHAKGYMGSADGGSGNNQSAPVLDRFCLQRT